MPAVLDSHRNSDTMNFLWRLERCHCRNRTIEMWIIPLPIYMLPFHKIFSRWAISFLQRNIRSLNGCTPLKRNLEKKWAINWPWKAHKSFTVFNSIIQLAVILFPERPPVFGFLLLLLYSTSWTKVWFSARVLVAVVRSL